ncbi:MAG TPA: CAP domain-containing protein [Geobacteraceae bacterium]|nr:CAP domain-containing protein [Geobacteraceae bacterium]
MILLSLLVSGPALAREALPVVANEVPTPVETYIHRLVNRIRGENHLPILKMSSPLQRLARDHSRYMANNGYLGHGKGNGRDFKSRIKKSEMKGWRTVGENVGRSFGYRDNARTIVSGWMESTSHRDNILSRDYDTTGIGAAMDEKGTLYATQIFLGSSDNDTELK